MTVTYERNYGQEQLGFTVSGPTVMLDGALHLEIMHLMGLPAEHYLSPAVYSHSTSLQMLTQCIY